MQLHLCFHFDEVEVIFITQNDTPKTVKMSDSTNKLSRFPRNTPKKTQQMYISFLDLFLLVDLMNKLFGQKIFLT